MPFVASRTVARAEAEGGAGMARLRRYRMIGSLNSAAARTPSNSAPTPREGAVWGWPPPQVRGAPLCRQRRERPDSRSDTMLVSPLRKLGGGVTPGQLRATPGDSQRLPGNSRRLQATHGDSLELPATPGNSQPLHTTRSQGDSLCQSGALRDRGPRHRGPSISSQCPVR
eukprot:gene12877-biopygen8620